MMTKPRLDSERIEVVDDVVAGILRRKTPAQRLAMCFEANRTMRLRLEAHLVTSHPDWGREQVMREVARRMSGGAV